MEGKGGGVKGQRTGLFSRGSARLPHTGTAALRCVTKRFKDDATIAVVLDVLQGSKVFPCFTPTRNPLSPTPPSTIVPGQPITSVPSSTSFRAVFRTERTAGINFGPHWAKHGPALPHACSYLALLWFQCTCSRGQAYLKRCYMESSSSTPAIQYHWKSSL